MVNLTNNLSKILDERGIKQTWLCEKAGISKQTLSNCIGGRHNISLIVALKIAHTLNLKIEDIWEYTDI